MEACNRRVNEIVELSELVYIVPNLLIRGVEDVSTVFMYIYPVNIFSVDISGDDLTFIYNEALHAFFL